MSHIVTIETEVRDVAALRSACRRLGLDEPVQEATQLFSGEATGYCVRLPDWTYPIVCNLAAGELKFDNFGGQWGEQKELDRFLQAYAVEMSRLAARRRGHTCSEAQLADGSIKLTVQVVGGSA